VIRYTNFELQDAVGIEESVETAELRPLSLGELLDRTFTLYRNHFWVFVGIMAIPSAVAVPMNFFAYNKQGSPLAFGNPQAQAAALTLPFWGFFAIFWLVYSLAMGAAAHAVAEAYLGRDPTVRGAYAGVRARFWPLIGLVLNVFLRVFGVFVVLVIAVAFLGGSPVAAAVVVGFIVIVALAAGGGLAIYLALRYAVSIPAFLFEQLGALIAIRRSVQLTKGRRGHIFLAAFLASIISYVGVIVFQGPFLVGSLLTSRNGGWPAWLNFTAAASGAIGASITGPILMIVIVLCYYDTRIRKEAFDLQFMMQSLDRPASAPPAAPPGGVPTA
jgi:hypothetical protein